MIDEQEVPAVSEGLDPGGDEESSAEVDVMERNPDLDVNPRSQSEIESPVVPDLPARMIMDLRTDCNLKCPMCVVHGDPDDPKLKGFLRRDTDMEKVSRVLDEVMAARPLFMPSLWSEPLLAKNFKAYVKGVQERGMSVAMNTNGLTLREPLAQFLVDIELDAIAFSIDAVTDDTLSKVRGVRKLKKLQKAVELMLKVRGEKALPRIGVSFTIQESNLHEEKEFVDLWAPKVDFVRTSYLYTPDGFPEINLTEDRKPCSALYTTMAMHVDGNVSYCCLDGFADTSVGNVFDEGVAAVWHGEKLNQVRHWHETGQWDKVPFCKNCDRWASYDFEEEVRDGLLIRRSPEYTYYNKIDRLENWQGALIAHHPDPQESLRTLGASQEASAMAVPTLDSRHDGAVD